MVVIYRLFQKLLNILINIIFIVQIALMIIVFLTATYWFLELLGFTSFDFVAPIADAVVNFMHLFYNQEVAVGGVYFDGSLLLFDLIAICLVVIMTKLKVSLLVFDERLRNKIVVCETQIENRFNEKLSQDLMKSVSKCNNIGILVQFSAKNMMVDDFWGGDASAGVKEKEDEAFKVFYGALKNIPECQFAKTGNKMVIICKDFSKIDSILKYIDITINRIRVSMGKRKWRLFSYIAVDVFDDKTPFKEVYPILERLLGLQIRDEVICLGNFCMRYDIEPESAYEPMLKGTYVLGERTEVWTLIKKN